jgi:hypothetical protein
MYAMQENALVCDVGIASYTKFENGTWIDAGKADDPDAGKAHGGGGCQVKTDGATMPAAFSWLGIAQAAGLVGQWTTIWLTCA